MKKAFGVIALSTLISPALATPIEHLSFSLIEITESGKIEGTVLDNNGLPIAYASVEIYKGKKLIEGTLTDGDGKFEIRNINYGEYTLQITIAGMKPYYKNIIVSTTNFKLNDIVIDSDVIQLGGLNVRAETSKVKMEIDKRTIEVGKDLVSSGALASDVFNNIPSLSVDQQSGELSLRGNTNVRVFLDGKPSSIPVSQLLKQLPSNAIEKIEIITNPSAKYNPEGNSGIINIITNKEKRQGYNLGLNAGIAHGKKSRYNGAINANWNTGKFNFFGNYNANGGERSFYGMFDNNTTGLQQNLNSFSDSHSHVFKFGFDWFINENNALTLYTNQGFSAADRAMNSNIKRKDSDLYFNDKTDIESNNNHSTYSLNYKRNFDKDGHDIELDVFYSDSKNEQKSLMDWNSPLQSLNDTDLYDKLGKYNQNELENKSIGQIKIDYTLPYLDSGVLEAGVSIQNEKTDNNFYTNQNILSIEPETNAQHLIKSQSVAFDFNRNIVSGYINSKYQFGKIGTQLGLRGEQVDLLGNIKLFGSDDIKDDNGNVKRNKFNFYPSIFITYQATENDQFSVNYSRRVDRPGIWALSPIRQWQTATVRREGNPNLKPQFTDSYELGYMKTLGKKGSVNAAIFYREVHDEMSRFVYIDDTNPNITILTRGNIENNYSYGAELSWFYKPINWWRMNGGVDMYNSKIKSKIAANGNFLEKINYNLTARLSNDFTVTPTLKLQLFTMYKSPEDNLQGRVQSMFRQDVGLRKSFMSDKLNLTARFSDLFNTFYARVNISNPQNQLGEFHWESQVLYLGLSYNFGGKVKTRTIKQNNRLNAEEQNDISF